MNYLNTLKHWWTEHSRRNGPAIIVLALIAVFLPNLITADQASAALSVAPPGTGRYGQSCLATTSDGSTSSGFATTTVFRIKCNWSPYGTYSGTTQKEHRPFASGCSPTCTDTVPASVSFQAGTGTVGSSDPDLRHWSSNVSRTCTTNTWTVVESPGTNNDGEWTFKCTSWSGVVGSNAPLENSNLIAAGSTLSTGLAIASSTTVPAGPTLTWADSMDYVAAASFAGSQPRYTWGTIASPFCGANVSSSTHAAGSYLARGDVMTFSVSWTSGQTGNIDVMFPGGRWQSIFVPGAIANPFVSSVTVDLPLSAVTAGYNRVLASETMMRCYDTLSASFAYLKYGSATSAVGDGRARPCDLAKLYWPRNEFLAVSQNVTWQYSYSGLVTVAAVPNTLLIEYTTWDSQTLNTPGPLASKTWVTAAASVPLGASSSFTIAAVFAAPVTQFILRCTDYLGTTYANQFTAAINLVGSAPSPADQEAQCYQNTGLGALPSSWVPGLVKLGSCVMKTLFVPQDSTLQALLDSASGFTAKAPFAYAVRGYTITSAAFTGAASGVTAHTADCLVIIDQLPTGQDVGSDAVCPVAVAPTSLSTFRTIAGYAAWLVFGFLIYKMSRKVVMA